MPIYEYSCPNCGIFEEIHKKINDHLTHCPTCGNSVKLMMSAGSFILNGPGFFSTDYIKNKDKKFKDSNNVSSKKLDDKK